MRKKLVGRFGKFVNQVDTEEPMCPGITSHPAPTAGYLSSDEPTAPMPSVSSLDDFDDGEEPTHPSPRHQWNRSKTGLTRHKILVVEDEGIVALDLGMTLQQMGYIVTGAATSGEEAVQMAIETMPDLVLVDICLRGQMDGIEASREIRQRLGVPIIFLTAFVDEKTIQRAESIMPAGFLRKPFVESELLEAIKAAIKPRAFY
jgi:CheY-like chemotaxis protein